MRFVNYATANKSLSANIQKLTLNKKGHILKYGLFKKF